MSESRIQSETRLSLGSLPNVRVFRNQVGFGWIGDPPTRRVKMGLFPGSGDLIGWTSYTITPDDVGKNVAVFTSAEIKSRTGKPSDNQVNWMNQVNNAGGIAFVTNNDQHAVKTIQEWKP